MQALIWKPGTGSQIADMILINADQAAAFEVLCVAGHIHVIPAAADGTLLAGDHWLPLGVTVRLTGRFYLARDTNDPFGPTDQIVVYREDK